MSISGSIQWGRVLLCAFLAALLSMLLIYLFLLIVGNSPGGDFYGLCPHEECDVANLGELIACILGQVIACAFKIMIYAILTFIPLSILISYLLVKRLIQNRQTLHVILSVLFSIPFAFLLLFLFNLIHG
jgi:hypothetical protein